jgi:hypothetical protein
MASTRRYSKEEFARRGDEIYETQVRPHLKAEDEGEFAAIDIESGEYEIDEDELEACDRLNARIPNAQIWLIRVGSRYLHRFGGWRRRKGDGAQYYRNLGNLARSFFTRPRILPR